jgi:hypothetical protein
MAVHKWMIILKCLLKKTTGWGVVDWVNLADDRDQWQAFVNMVMSLQVSYKVRNFLTS